MPTPRSALAVVSALLRAVRTARTMSAATVSPLVPARELSRASPTVRPPRVSTAAAILVPPRSSPAYSSRSICPPRRGGLPR